MLILDTRTKTEDRQPVDELSPGLPMNIFNEMMKQLKNMNNMMNLTHNFHSNRLPPGSGYVSTV